MRILFAFMALIFSLSAMEVKNSGGMHYYMLSLGDEMPKLLREKAETMYYGSYDPILHAHLTNEEIGFNPKFESYEKFIKDMFHKDFESYERNKNTRIFFFVTEGEKSAEYNNIVGVAVLLPQEEEGHYYIDHIGVRRSFQRRGIGSRLLSLLPECIADLNYLSLDTRVFNTPGQRTYDRNGFNLIEYPVGHKKRGYYLRYEKHFTPLKLSEESLAQ